MRATFVHHDSRSAETATAVLKRLKRPNDLVETVDRVVRLHMRCHALEEIKQPKKVRKLLGSEVIDVLVELVDADEKATVHENGSRAIYFREAVAGFRKKYPEMLPNGIVDGKDLIEAGFEPCEAFGEAIDNAYDAQLNGTTDRAALLKVAISCLRKSKNSKLT